MADKSSAASVSDGYDRWSSFYDQYPNPTVAIDELHFPKEWSHLAGSRVLEIGCGTGRHTIKLVDLGCDVTGIDASGGMLQQAKKKLAGRPAKLVMGDFLTSPALIQAGYEGLIASLVLEHMQDLDAFFQRAASLLRPGGELFLSEIHPDRAAQGILAHYREPGSDEEVHLQSYAHTGDQILAAAARASLELVSRRTVLGDEALAAVHTKWEKHLGQPLIEIWRFRR